MKNGKFWYLARHAREEVVEHANKPVVMGMPLFMMDQKLQAAGAFLGDYKVKHSVTGDVNISSIGRFMYPREHTLANGALKVETMHTFAAVPFIGANVTMWCSSTDAFSYSIGHKSAIGKALFRAYVKVCENAGKIEADDIMLDVLKRLD
ncbi:unnamed protein product [Phytophthora lilii]|uniref:Unnamed protein product n=1 Tax=Phytophthora lilii TaxID=2077276 RepID=A0A9W6X8P5_9STRA|nr:unnamed protein product [Phytophthora lilii]